MGMEAFGSSGKEARLTAGFESFSGFGPVEFLAIAMIDQSDQSATGTGYSPSRFEEDLSLLAEQETFAKDNRVGFALAVVHFPLSGGGMGRISPSGDRSPVPHYDTTLREGHQVTYTVEQGMVWVNDAVADADPSARVSGLKKTVFLLDGSGSMTRNDHLHNITNLAAEVGRVTSAPVERANRYDERWVQWLAIDLARYVAWGP